MACSYFRKNGDGSISSESIREFNEFLSDQLGDLWEYDTTETYKKIYDSLLNVSKQYPGEDYKTLEKYVSDYFSGALFGEYDQFLPPQGIERFLDPETRNLNKYWNSDNSTDNIENNEFLFNVKSKFLDDVFGNESEIKSEIKQKVTHNLLSNFIIDRNEGTIVTSIGEANQKVRQYKQQLFDNVVNYLKSQNKIDSDFDSTLFIGENYTGAFDKIHNIYKFIEQNGNTPSKIKQMYDFDKSTYDAFESYFILNNFDNFIDLLLGKSIVIHPNHKGKLTSGDGYAFSKKGGNVYTTWRTDDNIVLENEIGQLAQTLINSTPLYKDKIKINGKFIKFEDFYRIITKIKDLAIDPVTSQYLFNETGLYKGFVDSDNMSNEEIDLIEDKTLREIINGIRTNPPKYFYSRRIFHYIELTRFFALLIYHTQLILSTRIKKHRDFLLY